MTELEKRLCGFGYPYPVDSRDPWGLENISIRRMARGVVSALRKIPSGFDADKCIKGATDYLQLAIDYDLFSLSLSTKNFKGCKAWLRLCEAYKRAYGKKVEDRTAEELRQKLIRYSNLLQKLPELSEQERTELVAFFEAVIYYAHRRMEDPIEKVVHIGSR
ncbi:MAG: hypothetical protein AABX71_00820 [Nanoarchaeota archaeon]